VILIIKHKTNLKGVVFNTFYAPNPPLDISK